MQESTGNDKTSYKWWLVWAVTFLFSLLPPMAYLWQDVGEILEPLRRFGELLPVPVDLFHDLGTASLWMPLVLLVLLVLALRIRQASKRLICLSVFIISVFFAFYAAYLVVISSAYIVRYTDSRMELKAEREANARLRDR